MNFSIFAYFYLSASFFGIILARENFKFKFKKGKKSIIDGREIQKKAKKTISCIIK